MWAAQRRRRAGRQRGTSRGAQKLQPAGNPSAIITGFPTICDMARAHLGERRGRGQAAVLIVLLAVLAGVFVWKFSIVADVDLSAYSQASWTALHRSLWGKVFCLQPTLLSPIPTSPSRSAAADTAGSTGLGAVGGGGQREWRPRQRRRLRRRPCQGGPAHSRPVAAAAAPSYRQARPERGGGAVRLRTGRLVRAVRGADAHSRQGAAARRPPVPVGQRHHRAVQLGR